MIIAIDFDGTIVKHAYPLIGEAVPMAIESILELQSEEHKLILWTMRSEIELEQAVLYCNDKGINFYGVNENKQQKTWTTSPKAFANYCIDDAAVGCPLIYEKVEGLKPRRPYVDWPELMSKLRARIRADSERKK